MNRNSAIICSAVLLTGMSSGFIGGLWYAGKRDQPAELTQPVISEMGWEFSSGRESGPAPLAGPNSLVGNPAAAAESETPDIAWFPDALNSPLKKGSDPVEGLQKQLKTKGSERVRPLFQRAVKDATQPEQSSGDVPPRDLTAAAQPTPPGLLTPEQQELWKNQIKKLSAGEAEELLQIRQSLEAETRQNTAPPGDPANQIKPLSATESGDSRPRLLSAPEPGRLNLPSREELRPAMSVGPLLPDSIDLASGVRPEPRPTSPLLEMARQTARLNRVNASTIGYCRREILVVGSGTSGGHFDSAPGPELKLVAAESSDSPKASAEAVQNPALKPWVTRLDLHHGELARTRNQFDVAIRSDGWFRVQRDGRDGFTRSGLLAMDKENRLAVRTGAGLLPLEPTILLPADLTTIEIQADGRILARTLSESEATNCGQLKLVDFRDSSQLTWSPDGFYQATKATGKPFSLEAGKVRLLQGHLEQSNVDLNREADLLERLQAVAAAGLTP
jgi:flagellar basal body rod protein FlgG